MPDPPPRVDELETASAEQMVFASEQIILTVTLDLAAGLFRFEWSRERGESVARGRMFPSERSGFGGAVLDFEFELGGTIERDFCNEWAPSSRALLNRIRRRLPLAPGALRIGMLSDRNLGMAIPGKWLPFSTAAGEDPWRWLAREIQQFSRCLQTRLVTAGLPATRGQHALYLLACFLLKVVPERAAPVTPEVGRSLLDLRVTFNPIEMSTEFEWTHPRTRQVAARARVHGSGPDQLRWELETEGRREPGLTTHHRNAIREALARWLERFPTNRGGVAGFWVKRIGLDGKPVTEAEAPFAADESPYAWIEDNLVAMAQESRSLVSPIDPFLTDAGIPIFSDFERYERHLRRKEQKRAEEEARRRAILARRETERLARAQLKEGGRAGAKLATQSAGPRTVPAPATTARLPLPPVRIHLEMPQLSFQETVFPVAELGGYWLRERAALWWVSNQSDDLLSLPYCRIERLDYQIRAALRVLGPLRGRALLSDEVGLGKTIEAGLVIKELLTRGMVNRFLVLTVPSLVDQWEEELSDKFGLDTVTTNQSQARADLQTFWTGNTGIVASLHTLKQPAHLECARQVQWDILIVDEAHYLRNRDSQAWQAVNALSRQFLLLLTATPVQNSLEELYNLVTLLQPGQLPTPKEFRARFLNPKRPRQPREPEELRRLLGQVMIRNTRANAGVQLPPRRAETVSFAPDAEEQAFWKAWEAEFRAGLGKLNRSEASLWGRLILQSAGSSPAAWRSSLAKFPQQELAAAWREQAPLAASWQRKCQLLSPLTRGEGGVVVFTQFLETQASLADFLRGEKVPTFVINGSTPAANRQPITEEFRQHSGALLLTHSGTEGRNLQFCHRLVNFDLPWNPMEIEQRIGRLHRLGQQHPVRIYNFVQSGTLQEHLLQILQEKLNLFELVVGETGLVLGDNFSSDEFAEEILRRWRESEGCVAEAFATLGEQLAAARDSYGEVKKLDETLFAKDYESV
ncbi:MAG TPA: SNF2-related protein [Verrucomicrobiae bacterium]